MQDRYAGDVGDFMKLGLLRALARGTGLTLGVNWYLAPDEDHNADGRHTAYLDPANRRYASLRARDPELVAQLQGVVEGRRSTQALEASGALPHDSITYDDRLADGDFDRLGWHTAALGRLEPAEIVFADPDNGIRRDREAKVSKFAFIDELMDYADRGQTLVIYHHQDRTRGGVPVQVAGRLDELARSSGIAPLGGVIARPGSERYFFVLPAKQHREAVASAVESYASHWAPHAEFQAFVRVDPA